MTWIAFALFVLVARGVLVACRSTPKESLSTVLGETTKNAPVSARLQRVTLPFAGGEETFVYAQAGRTREGDAQGPLVLVHGTPGSLFGWSDAAFGRGAGEGVPAARGLAEDREVYLLDIVGHGLTPRPESTRPMTFQAGADWIGAFLEGLDLSDVTLVGHSYGGEFAWRAALDHPERIGRLVLVDSSGVPRRDDEWLSEEVAMREMSLAPYGYVLNSRKRLEPALALHFHRPLEDERVEEMVKLLDNADNWKAMVDLARDENGTRIDDLRSLTQPALLLWGADDHAYPPARFAAEFEARIPDVTLTLLEGLGHYPHEEDPAAFNAALATWLEAGAESER